MSSSLYRTSLILIKGLKKRNIPAGSVEYSVSNQAAAFQYTNHSSDEVFWCVLLSSSSIPIEPEQSFPTRAGRCKMDLVNERGNKNKCPDLIKTIRQMQWYAHERESLSNSVVSALCNTMDCSPPGSSVHGNLQTRIPEWAAIPFSRGSNLGLLRCRQILYCLSHQGSPEVFLDKLDFKFYESQEHAYCTHPLSHTVTATAKLLSHVLCDRMDCSLPGSSVYGILQTRILEWVSISSSRGSSQLRDQTRLSCIAGRFFSVWATKAAFTHIQTPVLFQILFPCGLLQNIE